MMGTPVSARVAVASGREAPEVVAGISDPSLGTGRSPLLPVSARGGPRGGFRHGVGPFAPQELPERTEKAWPDRAIRTADKRKCPAQRVAELSRTVINS